MKNLIYQYYKKPEIKTKFYIETGFDYHKLSEKSMCKYAEKYDIDYKILDGNLPHNLPPFFGIFQPFFEGWVNEYDSVCFVDSDIMATTVAKNIFDHTPNNALSANFMNTKRQMEQLKKSGKSSDFWIDKGHINSGVVVIPKSEYQPLNNFLKDINTIYNDNDPMYAALGKFDQAFINYYIRHVNRFHELPDNFNYHLSRKDHDYRFSQDFIHYHRKNKSMMKNDILNIKILK